MQDTSYLEQDVHKISFMDHFYATTLMLFTPEYRSLESQRKANGCSKVASEGNPVDIPTFHVEIDGVKIRYARHENPGKPVLLLMSPLPQSIIAFAPMWTKLTEEYDVWAYDLPGFGRSEGGYEFMTFKAQGEFLKKLIDKLGIADAHVVAPDIGMPTIIYYVATYSNTVKSIIIGDGPAIIPSSNGSIIHKLEKSKFWQFMIGNFVGSGAFVEVGNRIGYVNYTPNIYELSDYKKSYHGRLKPVLKWFKDYASSLATVDPLLDQLELPTLIFWGENDSILLKDNGTRLDDRMKNSKLHVLKNCGHFSYQDQSAEFSSMLSSWIEDHN